MHHPLRTMSTKASAAVSRNVCMALLLVCGTVMLLRCRAPLDEVELVLERHAEAVRKMPEEQREHLLPYGEPVPSELAADLLPEEVLPREAARRLAVRANPDIHAAQARLEAALARVTEARSLYYPTLLFTHNSTRTFQTPASRTRLSPSLQSTITAPSNISVEDIRSSEFALTTILNALRGPLFNAPEISGDNNPFSEHTSAFNVAYTIFDGFVREAQLMAAKHAHGASVYALADVERLIVQAVDTAYYQIQLAEEQIRIAHADEAFSLDQLQETQKLLDAGRANQVDVDNFKVRVLAAQATVTQAVGLRDSGRVVLAELMGISDVDLPEDLRLSPLEEETEEDLTAPDVDEWIARGLENRPDLMQLQEVLNSREENVRASRGFYYPSVTFSASYGFDRISNMNYSQDDQSSAAGVEFRWELYTGGAREARVREAESSRAEAAANLNRLQLAVRADVRKAVIDLIDAQERIRLQREGLKTASESRRIIQAAYVAGKETLIRLNEAQRDFIKAEADLALARIRLRRAWSDLGAAAATFAEEANGG